MMDGSKKNWWHDYSKFQGKRTNLQIAAIFSAIGICSMTYSIQSLWAEDSIKMFHLQLGIRFLGAISFMFLGLSVLSAYLGRHDLYLFESTALSTVGLTDIGMVLSMVCATLQMIVGAKTIEECDLFSNPNIFFCSSRRNLPPIVGMAIMITHPIVIQLVFKAHSYNAIALTCVVELIGYAVFEQYVGGSKYFVHVLCAISLLFPVYEIEMCNIDLYSSAMRASELEKELEHANRIDGKNTEYQTETIDEHRTFYQTTSFMLGLRLQEVKDRYFPARAARKPLTEEPQFQFSMSPDAQGENESLLRSHWRKYCLNRPAPPASHFDPESDENVEAPSERDKLIQNYKQIYTPLRHDTDQTMDRGFSRERAIQSKSQMQKYKRPPDFAGAEEGTSEREREIRKYMRSYMGAVSNHD